MIESVGLVKLGPKLKLSSKKVRSLKHRKLTKPALDRSNFNKIASWIWRFDKIWLGEPTFKKKWFYQDFIHFLLIQIQRLSNFPKRFLMRSQEMKSVRELVARDDDMWTLMFGDKNLWFLNGGRMTHWCISRLFVLSLGPPISNINMWVTVWEWVARVLRHIFCSHSSRCGYRITSYFLRRF